jgi:hypothetical protein
VGDPIEGITYSPSIVIVLGPSAGTLQEGSRITPSPVMPSKYVEETVQPVRGAKRKES